MGGLVVPSPRVGGWPRSAAKIACLPRWPPFARLRRVGGFFVRLEKAFRKAEGLAPRFIGLTPLEHLSSVDFGEEELGSPVSGPCGKGDNEVAKLRRGDYRERSGRVRGGDPRRRIRTQDGCCREGSVPRRKRVCTSAVFLPRCLLHHA